jgi:hypothetical protein
METKDRIADRRLYEAEMTGNRIWKGNGNDER